MVRPYRTSPTRTPAPFRARALAIVEVWTLTVWVGTLVGFAFFFAPVAFRIIPPDTDLFGRVVTGVFRLLTIESYVCGALAIVVAILRSVNADDRRADLSRVLILAAMIVLMTVHARTIVPEMEATATGFHGSYASLPPTDSRRVRYDELHRRSTFVYGAVVILGFLALAVGTARDIE